MKDLRDMTSDGFLSQAERNERFVAKVVDSIEGWLDRFTAKRTFDLLLAQERHDVRGGLYEVGLYRGKYFSLLVGAGFRSSQPVVGVDTFSYVAMPEFLNGFMEIVGPYLLQRAGGLTELGTSLIEANSTDVGPIELRAHFGGADARFISIDGSHEFDDVVWDLQVARSLLAPGGIVAVDDYLHPICLGVTAATDRFLATCQDLVPFAYVANKLFLSRPGWADRYRNETEQAILRDQTDLKAQRFKGHFDRGEAGRRDIEAQYTGYRILTVPMW